MTRVKKLTLSSEDQVEDQVEVQVEDQVESPVESPLETQVESHSKPKPAYARFFENGDKYVVFPWAWGLTGIEEMHGNCMDDATYLQNLLNQISCDYGYDFHSFAPHHSQVAPVREVHFVFVQRG